MSQSRFYESIFDCIPIGLFLVGPDKTICSWNRWMADKTKISEDKAKGSTFSELFPEKDARRYEWAVTQVLKYGHPQVLSQILNQYLVPIPLEEAAYSEIPFMQQYTEILPIYEDKDCYAVVIIKDMTDIVRQKHMMMQMGQNLEEQSFRDALTGLYNRRYLMRTFEESIARGRRDGQPISLCMYDIDFFKRINDTYGHDAGDEVLCAFVETINSNLRKGDTFARYGGEEFICLMPGAAAANAEKQANRMRELVQNAKSGVLKQYSITCSIGLVEWNLGNDSKFENLEAIIECADKALYVAKQSGRNQVQVFKFDD